MEKYGRKASRIVIKYEKYEENSENIGKIQKKGKYSVK
jgi:hypothetical protein